METEFIAAAADRLGYFHDESRLSGYADYIAFPEDATQAADSIRRAAHEKIPLTIQGARTGVAGGAVPNGGLIISTEKMWRPLGFSTADPPILRVQGGMSLERVTNLLSRGQPPEDWDPESKARFRKYARNLRFPPNPTESTASVGGAFAYNARGPNALRWGGVGEHIQGLVWLTPSGELWRIERGRYRFDETGCPLPDGRRVSCDTRLPVGGVRFLHPYPELDLVDFLAGGEGLLGFAAELSLRLKEKPTAVWGVVYFFEQDQAAIDFAETLRLRRESGPQEEALAALEYYDRASLDLVRNTAAQNSALRRLPTVNPRMEAAVQVELEGDDSETLEAMLTEQLELFLTYGGEEENAWAAASPAELEKFSLLRHAIPELINTELDKIRQTFPDLHKTAADFMVPPELVRSYRETYRRGIEEEGLRGFVFGHIAEGRLHVNLLPENGDALHRSRALIDRWAASVVRDGGLLAAENGIGRLKRDLIYRHIPPERLEQIQALIQVFDTENVLRGFKREGD
jgi:D-lactate dehydrogenase (cytochrome)